MADVVDPMVVRMLGDTRSYQDAIRQAQEAQQKLMDRMEKDKEKAALFGKTIDNLGGSVSNMAGQMGGMALLASPMAALHKAVDMAGEMELTESAFKTMLGSAEAGTAMVARLQKFAADTPLNMPGIESTTKMLLQFQVPADDIVSTLTMLGDAASGNQERMSRLALAYGQMRSASRVTTEELNQMRDAGFSPLEEMMKITGMSAAALREEISAGRVPFSVLDQALQMATTGTGRLAGGMKDASLTFKGLTSTMEDDIGSALRTLGRDIIIFFHLKDGVKAVSAAAKELTAWFQNKSEAAKMGVVVIASLVAGLGTLAIAYLVVNKAIGLFMTQIVGSIKSMIWATKSVWAYLFATQYATKVQVASTVALQFQSKAMIGVVAATNAAGASTRAAALAMGLLNVAMLALPVTIVAALVLKFADAAGAVKDFRAEVERTNKLNDRLAELRGKRTEDFFASIAEMDAPMKEAMLTKELEKTTKEAEAFGGQVKFAEKKVKELDTTMRSLVMNTLGWAMPDVGGDLELAKKNLDFAKKGFDDAGEKALKLRTELNKLKIEVNAATEKALAKVNDELIESLTTWGMSKDEVERWKLEMQGANAAQLKVIKGMQDTIALAKADEKAKEDLKKESDKITETGVKTVAELKEEIAAIGKTKEEVERLKLAKTELWAVDRKEIERLMDLKKAREEHQKLLDEGKKLTEEYRSPQEKFAARMEELDKILASGAITTEVYEKAMAAAKKELIAGGKEADRTADKLEGVGTGTAEAAARILAYREMLQGGPLTPAGPRRGGGVLRKAPAGFTGPVDPTGVTDWRAEADAAEVDRLWAEAESAPPRPEVVVLVPGPEAPGVDVAGIPAESTIGKGINKMINLLDVIAKKSVDVIDLAAP